jgi:hypothetical protein
MILIQRGAPAYGWGWGTFSLMFYKLLGALLNFSPFSAYND